MSKFTEFTFIGDTSLYSLSPLPPRCYPQPSDYQMVLQGGNGDKGFKIMCRRKPGTFELEVRGFYKKDFYSNLSFGNAFTISTVCTETLITESRRSRI